MTTVATYRTRSSAQAYANEIMRVWPKREAFVRLAPDGSFRYAVATIPKGARIDAVSVAWAGKRPAHFGKAST